MAFSVSCTNSNVRIWGTFHLEKFGFPWYSIGTKRRYPNSNSSGELPNILWKYGKLPDIDFKMFEGSEAIRKPSLAEHLTGDPKTFETIHKQLPELPTPSILPKLGWLGTHLLQRNLESTNSDFVSPKFQTFQHE